jgi:hypothetical protein
LLSNTQAVNLSGCTVRKEFNSGDKVESHTVYRKDLICSKAVFEGPVSFNGCRVEGSAYFADATFHYQETPVDCTATYFKKAFECNKATFKGPALFDSLECDGGGFFADATAVCSAVEP